jgi:hypothetical protein
MHSNQRFVLYKIFVLTIIILYYYYSLPRAGSGIKNTGGPVAVHSESYKARTIGHQIDVRKSIRSKVMQGVSRDPGKGVVLFRAGKREKIRIASWNVGSLTGRSVELVEALDRRRIDICCLQETRWKGGSARLLNGSGVSYKLFWVGSKEAIGGVGIVVAERWVEKAMKVDRINDRLLVVKIGIGSRIWNIVSAYAPQAGRSEQEKDTFWDMMYSECLKIPEKEVLMIGGDLNGHVGASKEGYQEIHGGFGFGNRNKEGVRILDFAVAMDLVICNTRFQKEDSKLITYSSGEVKSTVDYILIRRGQNSMVTDMKVIPGESCVEQHRLLVGVFKDVEDVKVKIKHKRKLRVWKLKNDNEQKQFQEYIRREREKLDNESDMEMKWRCLKSAMVGATEEICGWTRGVRRHKETWWWNEEVAVGIKRKRDSFRRWQKTRNKEDQDLYKELAKEGRKLIGKAKAVAREGFVNRLQSKDGRENLFRVMKQMVKENKDVVGMCCLKDNEGNILSDEGRVRDKWKEYMEKLMNEENNFNKENLEEAPMKSGVFKLISVLEVREAVGGMKLGKVGGPTGVVAEMIKAAGEVGIEWLTELCNDIISQGSIPQDWYHSISVPIYKGKGDPLECGSYRAVKLLEHTMKVVERVLEKRIREQIKIEEMQFGFMPGKGTTDAIFIARQMQEKFVDKKRDAYFAFIDLEKAFDRVPRDVLQWALRKEGVEEWLVQAVMGMYRRSCTSVRVAGGLSEKFEVKVGVHQGSVLSPVLFVIVMNALARELGGELPWTLLYADDILLIAKTERELRDKIKRWKDGLEVKGLKMNVGKTKVMVIGEKEEIESTGKWPCGVCKKGVGYRNAIHCVKCDKWIHKRCSGVNGKLRLMKDAFICRVCKEGVREKLKKGEDLDIGSGIKVEKVQSYCYLGDKLEVDGGVNLTITNRIQSAWGKFRELSPIVAVKGVPLSLKGKIYVSCIRPSLIYASETWAMKEMEVARLVRVERQMVRRMCGFSLWNKKKSEELLGMLGLESVGNILRRGRLRWFGHVERKRDDDWVKGCVFYEAEGKRPRGRPVKKWMDNIKEDMKLFGLKRNDAQDRARWRSVIGGKTDAK